ncbi:unnamed protein product [Urochloa humidicola]
MKLQQEHRWISRRCEGTFLISFAVNLASLMDPSRTLLVMDWELISRLSDGAGGGWRPGATRWGKMDVVTTDWGKGIGLRGILEGQFGLCARELQEQEAATMAQQFQKQAWRGMKLEMARTGRFGSASAGGGGGVGARAREGEVRTRAWAGTAGGVGEKGRGAPDLRMWRKTR